MRSILDILLPYRCGHCKQLISLATGPFCNDCRAQIKFSNDGSSMFSYAGLIRELILSAKFKPDESVSRILSRLLDESLKSQDSRLLSHPYDFVTYVPSHFRRRLARGHELPAILASALSRHLKKPLRHLLCCSRFDPPLSASPSATERLAKVSGRYRLVPNRLKPSSILLVDDVVTTGATLQSAARVLEISGHSVATFAFAKTSLALTTPGKK